MQSGSGGSATVKSWSGDASLVVATVALILAVAALIVGLVGPDASRPVVVFDTAHAVADGFSFQVVGVSAARSSGYYSVTLSTGEGGPAHRLVTDMEFTIAGDVYTVHWGDDTLSDYLSAGDTFSVTTPLGLTNAVYTVQLLWRGDGNALASEIYIPPPPTVYLSDPRPITDGFRITVDGVSIPYRPSLFELAFCENTDCAPYAPPAPAMTFVVSGNVYSGTWTDRGGDGKFSSGDSLSFTRAGGLVPSMNYRLELLWIYDGILTTKTYMSP